MWILLAIILLVVVLIDPHLLWMPVILGGMYGVMWGSASILETIFPPLIPEEKKEKEKQRCGWRWYGTLLIR